MRPFQDVLLDLGARLKLPGLRRRRTARRAIPAATPTTSPTTSARPGIGPLAGWRGADGDADGRGAANPRPARGAMSPTAASGGTNSRREQRFYKLRQRRLSRASPCGMGFVAQAGAHRHAALLPSRCRNSASPPRATARSAARRAARAAAESPSIRCRSGMRRSRRRSTAAFPLHALTQRPMAMYHSWGSQNAWLRQILEPQRALRAPTRRRARWASRMATGCG